MTSLSETFTQDGGYDLHCHYMPANMPKWSEKFGDYVPFFWIKEGEAGFQDCAWMMKGDDKFRSLSGNKLWSPEQYIDAQADRGIDVMALSPTPQNFYYNAKPQHAEQIAQFQNDTIAELQREHAGSFYGLGTIPLQDPERACKELERCKKDLGLAGVEIGTTCMGEDLDQEKFFQVFETAAKIGACVFVHPWYMPNTERLTHTPKNGEPNAWANWLLDMPSETTIAMYKLCMSGLTQKLPDLRIGFGHGGGSFPWLLARIKHGVECRPEYYDEDVDVDQFAKSVFYDAHVCDVSNLRFLIDTVGASQIMGGSDWPYPLGVDDLKGYIDELQAPDLIKQLMTDTPRRFLGLSS